MVSNEVYTGAGASATLIPEADLDVSMQLGTIAIAADKLGLAFKNSAGGGTIDRTSLSWGSNATGGSDHVKNRLPVNIYQGCFANISKYANGSTSEVTLGTFVIKSNDANSITFDRELSSTNNDRFSLKILGFGTPLFTPSVTDGKHNLLADNWLGLVNTITPPSVDAEMKLWFPIQGSRILRKRIY